MAANPRFFGLRFDNHISLGHIITTFTILVGGLWWAADAAARIASLEKFDTYIENRLESERLDRRADMAEIKVLLKEIRDELRGKADKE